MEPLRAELPPHIEYANADIYCSTPSLIAVVMEFVLDDELRGSFDNALHQDRKTYVTPTESGYKIHDPENQRIAHIEQIRRDTSAIISNWISDNVPGLFAAGLLNGTFPTCEFVTLRKAKPFPTRNEPNFTYPSYMWELGLNNSFGAWECTQLPGLRFAASARHRNTAPQFHSILAINDDDWLNGCGDDSEKDSRVSRIYRMHQRMVGLIGTRAILSLLQGYAQHFKELRNSPLFGSASSGQAEEALQAISESVSFSVDIAAVTTELSSTARRGIPIGLDIAGFTPCSDPFGDGRKTTLGARIQNRIEESASWLNTMETSIRDQLTQYGTLIGTLEDVRLQKRIRNLTNALLLLTAVIAVPTILSIVDLMSISDLLELVKQLGRTLGF